MPSENDPVDTDQSDKPDELEGLAEGEIENIEEIFVGAILRNEANAAIGLRYLNPAYFSSLKTRILAQAIIDIADDGGVIQTHTVIEHLRNNTTKTGKKLLDLVTKDYVYEVALAAPEEGAFDTYWRSIKDRWEKRQIQEFTLNVHTGIKANQFSSASDAIRFLEERILALSGESENNKASYLSESYVDVIDSIAYDVEHKGEIVGIPTGFDGLDEVTGGLRAGQLIIVAGQTGAGKTSFAMNAAASMATINAQPVLFFSLEMSDKELVQRMISSHAEIPYQRIRDRTMVEADWLRVASLNKMFSEAPLKIVYESDVSFLDIKSHAYQMANESDKPPLIIVDYLQLMNLGVGQNRYSSNKNDLIGDVTRGLKVLAGDLETTVIVLSQLNRQSDYRDNKRPLIGDLRDSGAIGQDADLVLFTYRDETYFPGTGDQGIAELIIAKHRAGRKGTIKLGFMSQYTKFINLVPHQDVSAPSTQQTATAVAPTSSLAQQAGF